MTENPAPEQYPLTSGQQGIWFDQMLHPDKPLYNMGGYLRIDGAVDARVFEAALCELVRQCDALRIVLRAGREVPTQEFLTELEPPFRYLDFSDRADPEGELLAWVREQLDLPFELYDAPLFRFALVRVSGRRFYWFHAYHHMIVDAYAHSLMVQRLAKIYTALMRGAPADDDDEVYSYRDYVAQDAEYFGSHRHEQDARYWREKFETLPEPLVERKGFGDRVEHRRSVLTLPRDFYDRMIAFARERDASTFHLILTALYVHFTRTTARDDFVIGLPTLNRGSARQKRTVGLFTGITPAWFRLGRTLSPAELMRAIGQGLRRDYRYQRIPISQINRAAGLHKENRVQLFDIVLTYQRQSYAVEYDGHPVEQFSLRHGSEQTPLAVEVSEYNDLMDVRVNIDYSLTAFDGAEIELLKDRLVHILRQVMARPDAPVSDIEILPDAERRLLLEEFQGACAPSFLGETLTRLFERQAARAPDAEAVVFEGTSVTYAELNERANRLAHHLRLGGLHREEVVGVCAERSIEMVVALLGVLKAGGAYLPLDPTYPAERLAFMLEDSGARVVLTQSRLAGLLPRNVARVVRLDADWDEVARRPSTNPEACARPENLAYVIYTSGSTGRPKGAMVTHEAIANRILWMQAEYGLGADDRVLQKTPFGFDVSVWEFFWPLVTGARLVVARPEGHKDAAYLSDLIVRQRITTAHFVPSMLQAFLDADGLARCASLRRVICSGEALPAALRQKFFGLSRAGLHNLYGPTEAAVDVTAYACSPDDAGRTVPIGKAISNVRIYVLDERMRPSAVGAPGELHIGGVALARGYLGRPALTAEKFVPDPFSAEPGARLYRTGDSARYLPDGNVEFLGRLDDQVKVRGFRVELGEIKSELRAHTAVADCEVLARADGARGDEARLVAYVVPAPGERPSVTELRSLLRKRLPDYMIPSAFVTLDALPLGAHGKVDRRALPAPDGERPSLAQQFVEPSEGPERQIAEIWKETLGLERVGVHDNFFELGGHSLKLAHVRARLAQKFERPLSMVEMFRCPTIHTLSNLLGGAADGNGGAARGEERAQARNSRAPLMALRRELRNKTRLPVTAEWEQSTETFSRSSQPE